MFSALFEAKKAGTSKPNAKKAAPSGNDPLSASRTPLVSGLSKKQRRKQRDRDKRAGVEPVAGAGAQQRDSSGSRSSRELNATLSRLARGKQLAECRAAFAMGSASGSADSWSHAILINAHATCGDGDGALAALAAMRAAGHRPCVMSYTAALKAPCGRGDLDVARGILAEMEAEFGKPGLPKADDWTPNVRTANTFFRGCLVSGGVDDARALLKRLGRGVWAGVAPDTSTLEYVGALCAQALQLNEAVSLADRAIAAAAAGSCSRGGGGGGSDNGSNSHNVRAMAMVTSIATAHATPEA